MCAIAAVSGTPDPHESDRKKRVVNAILNSLSHRGDIESINEIDTTTGAWLLGTRRLAIVSQPAETQPSHSKNNRYSLVLNGEIYNYLELASELSYRGVRPTFSDTEILCEAISRWGLLPTLQRLNWEGAFIALDKVSGRLYAARDHLGIKPLYWCRGSDGWAIASEIKALTDIRGCKEIFPVPPGSIVQFDYARGAVDTIDWWRPSFLRPAMDCLSFDVAARTLGMELQRAVASRLPSEPFALSLSGGLDSAAILACCALAGRLPTAYVLKRPDSPDLPYARQMAKLVGANLVEVDAPSPSELRENLPNLIRTVESWEWHVVNHAAPMTALVDRMHSDGFRVALSGEGADELLLGYNRVPKMGVRQEQIARIENLHKTNCRRLDRMFMGRHIEMRVPFLDRRIVELALTIPENFIYQEGKSKPLLKAASADIVPALIRERSKLSMSQGVGYTYGTANSYSVFGPLIPSYDREPMETRSAVEAVFKKYFDNFNYSKATYMNTPSI